MFMECNGIRMAFLFLHFLFYYYTAMAWTATLHRFSVLLTAPDAPPTIQKRAYVDGRHRPDVDDVGDVMMTMERKLKTDNEWECTQSGKEGEQTIFLPAAWPDAVVIERSTSFLVVDGVCSGGVVEGREQQPRQIWWSLMTVVVLKEHGLVVVCFL